MPACRELNDLEWNFNLSFPNVLFSPVRRLILVVSEQIPFYIGPTYIIYPYCYYLPGLPKKTTNRGLLHFMMFSFKSGMSVDWNALHRPVVKVSNRESPEEELVAEESPLKDCIPVGLFKLTVAAMYLLSPKCYTHWERPCPCAWQQRIYQQNWTLPWIHQHRGINGYWHCIPLVPYL